MPANFAKLVYTHETTRNSIATGRVFMKTGFGELYEKYASYVSFLLDQTILTTALQENQIRVSVLRSQA
jgi:hypothetical protein